MVIKVLLCAALAAGLGLAQKGGGKGGSKAGDDSSGFNMRPTRQSRFDVISEKLKLSKEQKEEAAKIFDAAQETVGQTRQQIVQGRDVITNAILAGKGGETLDKMMEQYTALLAQMTRIEAEAYGKLYATLKPNQQSKAPAVFEEQMAGMFMGRDWKR